MLASDIPGIGEFIQANKTGYMFESENFESLTSKLIYIYEQHDFKNSEKYISGYKQKYNTNKLTSEIISFINKAWKTL